MATKTKHAPKRRIVRHPRRRAVTRAELGRACPGLVPYLEATRPGFAGELKRLRRPRWASPAPPTSARAAGVHFDVEEVDRVLRFCRKLRHIKGRRFAGRPFVPDLWQVVYVIAPLFGWKRADGTRYYRFLYLEVPRKNGKSTLCAAIALYLLTADREPGAEVYSVGRDSKQARAVFDVAAVMAKRSPALRRRLKALIPSRVIRYEATASVYEALSSDKEGLAKHGLNVHGCVIDELHVITDGELVTTLETGTGSRDEPVVAYITTAGIESASPVWAEKRDLAIKIADGRIERADFLGVIYAADPACVADGSWRDPEVWADANPGLGASLRPDYIAGKAAEAEQSPASLNAFLRLHLDVPTEAASGWVALSTWDRSASIVEAEDLAGCVAYGGLDLASALDLAALVLVFPDGDIEDPDALDVLCRFWTPADTLIRRQTTDRGDYAAWRDAGFLTATPGETIDFDAIETELGAVLDTYDVRRIGYDPWGSKQLERHLLDAGAPLFAVRQGFQSLSPPMREAEKLVVDRRLRHGGNPVLRWCIGNTVAVQDPAGNIKPDRKRSRSRIDGTAALIMALDAWLRDASRGHSVYEERGMEVAG